MKILALAGKRKSGKTYSAEKFIEVAALHGHTFRKVSFATELRKQFAETKGIVPSLLTENFAKEEYREQLLEYAKNIKKTDPKYFIKCLFDSILDYESVVIDDLRFIEEFEEIYKRGGVIYKVEADIAVLQSRGWKYTPEIDDDTGETELGGASVSVFSPYGGHFYNNEFGDVKLKKELNFIFTKHFK